MNKLLLRFFFILLAIIIFEVGYYLFITEKIQPSRSNLQTTRIPTQDPGSEISTSDRTEVYTSSNLQSPYPGSGLITKTIEETLLIFPLPTGSPIYAPPSEENKYSDPVKYQMFHIQPDNNAMAYTVGYLKNWETIERSKDKIIVLVDPNNESITYSYRVAFEKSDLFGENLTALAVENTDKVKAGAEKTVDQFNTLIAKLPTSAIDNLIKKGDTIIVTPLFDPPEPNKKDENGTILAGWIIIRRAHGKSTINQELGYVIE